MQQLGHTVQVWAPRSVFSKLPVAKFKKWFGYLDQFLVFPIRVKRLLKSCPTNTLFVFADQALGPWVRLVANRPHVIHCHDFLAQFSALGQYPQNPTGFTGRLYQQYIRRGYSKGQNFIPVSKKTQYDLLQFLQHEPRLSEVVYNGLNQPFKVFNVDDARIAVANKFSIGVTNGFLLHVGGNDWYKNREGVIAFYNAWRQNSEQYKLPLLLVGLPPSPKLQQAAAASSFTSDIHFLTAVDGQYLNKIYAAATALLFPSLAEGFGWPIAEAMASGTLVITTNMAPMTEVGGSAAYYIDAMPTEKAKQAQWATVAAQTIVEVVTLTTAERDARVQQSIKNAQRFNTEKAIAHIEDIYKKVLQAAD